MLQLPDLPYAQTALSPHMSEQTLAFHHGKHHAACDQREQAGRAHAA
jgi:superoxide dismutase